MAKGNCKESKEGQKCIIYFEEKKHLQLNTIDSLSLYLSKERNVTHADAKLAKCAVRDWNVLFL